MQPNGNRPHYQLHAEALLYRRGVQHNANGSTERLSGEGRRKLGPDNARVTCSRKSARLPKYKEIEITMRSGNLAPDHSDLGTPDLLLAPVDVGNLLAKIEATGYR